MKQSNSPNLPRYGGNGGGLTVQELKQMTALRMSQRAQGQQAITPPIVAQRPESHPYNQRGNYAYASGGHAGADDRHRQRSTPPPRIPPAGADKHRSPDGRAGKPLDAPMPHGLTVQELKELTRIRLEREALERRSPGGGGGGSESSASDTESLSRPPASGRSSTYFTPAPPPPRSFPTNSRNTQQTMLHPNSKPFTPPQPLGAERRVGGKADRPPRGRANGPSGISDTSSTRSVSSSSTDEMSERTAHSRHTPVMRVPEPEPWELVSHEQLGNHAAVDSRPSAMGSAIRQILTLDIGEPAAVPPPPPPSWGLMSPGENPLSPRSLKNRPQMAVECPEEIRRRSRSDSLAFEMAEAVLGTPPGSPVQPAINRKRMSGGSATAFLLAGNISPAAGYSTMDPSVPEDSVLRRSDSGDAGGSGGGLLSGLGGSMFKRGSGNIARQNSGSSENSSAAGAGMFSIFGGGASTWAESSFFPRRSSSLMSFFQGVGTELGPTEGNLSPSKGASSDIFFGAANKDNISKNKAL